MKRLVVGLGLLGIAIGTASGCDDTRPVAGLPPDGQAGEMSRGGEPGAAGGGTTPSEGGADSAGAGQGGQSQGGQSQGGQSPEVAGAGGAAP